ncbi:complex I NDUFA9 subunit family protein [uncultured Cohaesibacter sp.]|uniref:complex I NDUFA9 subunit family protein n=1 Tax=uncultured Cohaesibacter sp. TaxID=1002546 RepID=UPI00292F3D5D|nr:complex I NDUFA9 subunit family protein [uncultured Cohaesibacter sp.]
MKKPSEQIVTVFGGSGFLGRHVVGALARRGYRIRVAVRKPNLAGYLQPLGTVGQIMAVQANLRDGQSVAKALSGSDAVINLVGILFETSRQKFSSVHRDGARRIAQAAKDAGVGRFVQISAIGADKASHSAYARSKAEGEEAVLTALPDAIIMRPSLLIGAEDDFFNKFAAMADLSPFLPLVGGGQTLFQPAFVGDVAEAIARAVDGELEAGRIYELGGPDVKSFRNLLEMMIKETGKSRLLLPIPLWTASAMGWVFEKLPMTPVLTQDQVKLLKSDNVVSEQATKEGRDFAGIGINPTAIEAILPSYLWRYRDGGQYDHNPAA